MGVKWRGKQVKARIGDAARKGVDSTMSLAVIQAKSNHAWNNRTGTLEGSIKTSQPAAREGNTVRGLWGSTDVRYALIHELGGAPGMAPGPAAIPARPYLRPAADATYPMLARQIRRFVR